MPSRSSRSSTRAAVAAEGDVRAHVEVREQRVLLEHEADRAAVGRPVDPARGVEPDVVAERDPPRARAVQPGDRAQHGRLARAGRADQRERLPADGQLGADAEGAKRDGDVELELRQWERSLYGEQHRCR